MRLSILSPLVAVTWISSFLHNVSATRLIESTSLNTCQANSSFTASLFNVVFTPDNRTLSFDVVAVSSIQGNVTFSIQAFAYGYPFLTQTLNPCDLNLAGMCPMSTGQIDIPGNIQVSQSVVDQFPGIAYAIPDLDATVKVQINGTANPHVSLACVEAQLSNGQTVDQKGVSWATAVIAGLALVVSAVVSGLGHSNTATHIASYALSLFGYFQAVAIIGLVAVPEPPIVQAWTQNFQWTMGIINVNFMQSIATWYLKATGGTPATLLNTLTTTSVQVEKRSLGARSLRTTIQLLEKAHSLVYKRTNNQNTINEVTGTYTVIGIDRVAFRAGMEATNLFFTGLAFFCIFVLFTIIGVALFKGFCELAVKARWVKSSRFQDFRNGWLVVLKGIMFRMVLIGYPQMTILCLWEFTQVNSPAEVVLAIFFFFGMSFTLGWAAFKVIRIAKRSTMMHKNPAYILYSDPTALNKWGFLYVSFRATAYYYVLPILLYIIVKGMFVAFAQKSGYVQGISLVLIEVAALIGASVIRPWMDKSTNTVNISIAAINFINAIMVLVFSDIFDQPPLVTGVMGVVFFVLNAVFSLVLLILVVVAVILSIVRKNPDARYQPMADDRASFIKSQTQLTTELDALGATARGDMKGYKPGLDLEDDDNDSWSSDSIRRNQASQMPLPPSTANSRDPPHSPVDPSVPLFPSGTAPGAQTYHDNPSRTNGFAGGYFDHQRQQPSTGSLPYAQPRAGSSQVSLTNGPYRMANNASPGGFRAQNTASPWQRGAGYDH